MPVLEHNRIRGVKRKRLDKESEEDREAKLRRKLYHALRELRKVVKKARTFEVQKTLKKLKDAWRKDQESDVVKDLEAQMEILKHLSHDQLAHSALMTKLKKDKTLSADPTIQAVTVELALNLVSSGAPGTPTAKVQSRILSSKALASGVMSIVETLRAFLHPSNRSEGEDFHASPNISKKRKTGAGHGKDALLFKDDAVDPSGEGRDEGHEDASGDEAVAEVDDGWESGTVDAPSASDDPVAVAEDHDSSSEDSADLASTSKESRPHRSKGQSEFLPSLSVGFTRGDSDSGFSDSESKFLDRYKKNRRGQRARRAIWEKKYGTNANHVKKQRDTERRKPGTIPVDRRSAKGNPSSHSRLMPIQSRAGHEQVQRLRSDRVKSSKTEIRPKGDLWGKQGEAPLHPSWEAKRKQKSASIVPSQGTKIVFSDS